MKKFFYALLTISSASLVYAQEAICITEIANELNTIDAAISNRTDYIDNNYEKYRLMRLAGGTGFNVGSRQQDWRSLNKWKTLDDLPENAIIVSASVTLTENNSQNYLKIAGHSASSIYLIKNKWSANKVTWNNQPTYNKKIKATMPDMKEGFGTVQVDLTDLVTEIVENDLPNHGFLWRVNNENPYNIVTFNSSDAEEIDKRPVWQVCYKKEEVVEVTSTNNETPEEVNVVTEEIKATLLQASNIQFKRGTDEILKESYSNLDSVVYIMKSNPKFKLEVRGYTDNTGSEKLNKILSIKRASTTRQYLIDKGILANRIKAYGYGSKNPIADNNTEEGRKKNRRVEFEIKL